MKTIITLAMTLLAAGTLQAQTWTGATNNDWGTASNWSPASVPTSSSNVTIPSSLSTYPKLGTNVTIANFTMASGASLNMNGHSLTATGDISMNTATVTSGDSLSKTGAGAVNVISCTITATTTFYLYTGQCHVYDNTITGKLTIINASTQNGDNFIDGNSVTGDVVITQNSNNAEMDEGYASPSSTPNHFTGNTTFTLAGSKNLITSYSRATQFTGNVTFAHTGSGNLTAFNANGTISGNLSLTANNGSNSLNASSSSNVTVGGTVNITISSGAQAFTMRKIKNSTAGGTISVTNPTSVDIQTDTIKSNLSVTGYTSFAHIYDNSITGNVTISNASTQNGDNFIDGNSVTGDVAITQNSNNYDMDEGYASPSSTPNHFTGNTTFTLAGSKDLITSYSRATQFTGNVTFAHTGSGSLTAFNANGTISGNLSLTANNGSNSLNASSSSNVTVGGTVNITISSGAQAFTMKRIKNSTAGGNISVSSVTSVNIQYDTLKANLSVTGYTGACYVYDNSIAGNVTLSNTASQTGDDFVDGNNITGSFSLTNASNNSPMYEGYGSPTAHPNVINGNTTFTSSGSQTFYSCYSRPTQFNGNLTVSHTGAGTVRLFYHSGSVTGDLSVTTGSGAGSLELNPNSVAPTASVGGKVNITMTSGGSFAMTSVKNSGSGGTITITNPSSVNIRYDTLKSPITVSGFTSNFYFYDNSINGSVTIANAASQVGDSYVDGNQITGDFNLTQATSSGYTMYEGTGSPSANSDKITGNTHITISGSKGLVTGYSHAGTYGGNITITHTGSGYVQIFNTGTSTVGGSFSMTSTWGAGSVAINPYAYPTVLITGTLNILDSNGNSFNMTGIANNASGGNIRVVDATAVSVLHDTVKSNVTILRYTGNCYIYDNNIAGDLALSNAKTQSGDNYYDGNNVTGNYSVTHASLNSTMYEGNGSPTGHGTVVGGDATFNLIGSKDLHTCYNHSGQYGGNLTVYDLGGGGLDLFHTTGSVGGNFTLTDHDTAGYCSINGNNSDVVDVGGKVRVIRTSPAAFTMNYIRSSTPHDTVSVYGVTTGNLIMMNDTLSSAVLLRNFANNFYMYSNKITGETFLADSSTKSGDFYMDGNMFNGSFSLIHKSSSSAYDGFGAATGNWVTGIDSIVNLSGAGTLYLSYGHSHQADSSFILNSAGNVNFSTSNPLIFGGNTGGKLRNYGTQQVILPKLTLAKTGGSVMKLEAPLSISNTLTFTSGYIDGSTTSPLVFTSGAGYSGASDASHSKGLVMKVGNAAFTFPTGDGSYYLPCGISAPSNATDTFTGQYMRQAPIAAGYDTTKLASTINHVSRWEYWLINRSTTTTSNVKVTLAFNPYSGVDDLSALTVAHWYDNGSVTQWFDEGKGSTTGTVSNGTITSNNTISSFSPFTLASTSSANPLPIHLLEFTVKPSGHSAVVNWRTGNELGNEQYHVQRSNDGQHFETIGTVAAQGSGFHYNYVDPLPKKGLNYYRLAIEEPGLPLSYSVTRVLRFDETGAAASDEVILYPNPAEAAIYADGLALHNGAVLSLRSITGQLIHQETLNGQSRVEVSLQNLPAGAYLLNIDDANGPVYRGRFIRR